MSDNNLSGKVGLDTTDFKTGISEMNRQIRVIESGFRAAAAGMGDWDKSSQGLETRIKALNGEIELQKQKVNAVQKEFERVAAEKGANSRAAEELQIKLNKETETLNKEQAELDKCEKSLSEVGKESKETGEKVEDLGKKEDDTREKTSKFGSVMSGLGGILKGTIAAVAGLAAAVAGVGAAISKLVLDSAKAAGELVDLSAKTGISTTRLQELAYVGDQVGTSSDTMTGSLSKLTRSMSSAQLEAADVQKKLADAAAEGKDVDEVFESMDLGDSMVAFRRLGVDVTDATGNLRDSEKVFSDVIDALGGLQNETERDALALQIFGKSAMELNPLIKAGSSEIARLSEEAHKMGAVMSEENVAALEEFDDTIAGLKNGFKGILGTIAGAFLPGFKEITGKAQEYMQEFGTIVTEANGDLGKMAEGIGGLIGDIVNDIAGEMPELVQAGLGIVQGIVNAVTENLPVMLPAAITMIKSLLQFLIDNIPLLVGAGVEIVTTLVEGILPMLPMLIEAALKIIIALATGITEALPELIPVVVEIIPQIILMLLENLPLLIEAALQLILALAEGLIAAIPILIPYIPEITQAIFDAIIESLPLIGEAAVELILALAEGIVGALPEMGDAAIETIDIYINGILDLIEKIVEVGANIVGGVWDGIKSQGAWFASQINSFFSNIVEGVKDSLGIHSESTVFAGIGKNLALGLGGGFEAQFKAIERNIQAAVTGLSASVSISGTAGASMAGSRSTTYNLGGIHIHVSGKADSEKISAVAEIGVLRALKAAGAV